MACVVMLNVYTRHVILFVFFFYENETVVTSTARDTVPIFGGDWNLNSLVFHAVWVETALAILLQ